MAGSTVRQVMCGFEAVPQEVRVSGRVEGFPSMKELARHAGCVGFREGDMYVLHAMGGGKCVKYFHAGDLLQKLQGGA